MGLTPSTHCHRSTHTIFLQKTHSIPGTLEIWIASSNQKYLAPRTQETTSVAAFELLSTLQSGILWNKHHVRLLSKYTQIATEFHASLRAGGPQDFARARKLKRACCESGTLHGKARIVRVPREKGDHAEIASHF